MQISLNYRAHAHNNKPVQDTWADGTLKTNERTKLPIWKQQDRQVTKDDLDKAKNTNAVEVAGLTAMGLGEGDPYPMWTKDTNGAVVLDKDGKPAADPFVLSYKPGRRERQGGRREGSRKHLISMRTPGPWWLRMDSVPS